MQLHMALGDGDHQWVYERSKALVTAMKPPFIATAMKPRGPDDLSCACVTALHPTSGFAVRFKRGKRLTGRRRTT